MRASNFSAPAEVVSVSVLIESIGTAWRTGFEAFEDGADDALRRRIGADELGSAASIACSSWNSASYSASGISGASST
jgi:hypothetical protein